MFADRIVSVLENDEHALLRDTAFIDGAWVAGERTFDVTNPADGSLVGTVPSLGAAEATLAVDAAARAGKSSAARRIRCR